MPHGYGQVIGNRTHQQVDNRNRATDSPKVAKISKVASAVAELELRLDNMSDRIVKLRQALTPVTAPEPPQPEPPDSKGAAVVSSNGWLVNKIEDASMRVARICAEVDEIVERLEI